MRTPDNFDGNYKGRIIYIDGEPRTIIIQSAQWVQVDSPSLPGRPCSQHRLDARHLRLIFAGAGVYTSGSSYTSTPPKPKVAPPPPPPPPEPAALMSAPAPKEKVTLATKLKAAIRAFQDA